MDRVFSTRIDEAAVRRVEAMARLMRTSKKKVIEKAIEMLAESVEERQAADVFERTSGAWRRNEPPARTARRARNAFERSMLRNKP